MVEVIQLWLILPMGKSDHVWGLHQYFLCVEGLCWLPGGKWQKSYTCPSPSVSSVTLLNNQETQSTVCLRSIIAQGTFNKLGNIFPEYLRTLQVLR